jgi:hypothetical protein
MFGSQFSFFLASPKTEKSKFKGLFGLQDYKVFHYKPIWI